MSEPGETSGGSGSSNESLAEYLYDVWLKGTPSEFGQERSLTESERRQILGLIQNIQNRLKHGRRWRMTSEDGCTNPLSLMRHNAPIQIRGTGPDGAETIRGCLSKLITENDANPTECGPMPSASRRYWQRSDAAIGDKWALKSDSGEDDDEQWNEDERLNEESKEVLLGNNAVVWDQNRTVGTAAPAELISAFQLKLTGMAQVGWQLNDVFLYVDEHSTEPLAVLTVRQLSDGYELSFDTADTELIYSPSVHVDLHFLPLQGA